MPTYTYRCHECGVTFDRFQHFAEEPLKECPECSGAVRRIIHPVGIIFKGSGFYVTDNNKNGSPALAPKTDGKSEGKGDDKPATPEKSAETAGKSEESKSSATKGTDSKSSASRDSDSRSSATKDSDSRNSNSKGSDSKNSASKD